jgi:NADH-quinone oxidoreductase subunit C
MRAVVELEEHLAVRRLREAHPRAVLEVAARHNEVTVLVARDAIERVCRLLRDDPDLAFDFLSDLTGVDRLHLAPPTPRFEVVYHLFSLQRRSGLRLKVRAEEGEAVPTVTGVWAGANWFEREVYDLLGVPFAGHPDLRRIVLPDDWQGHPLRKDYAVEASPRWWEEGEIT